MKRQAEATLLDKALRAKAAVHDPEMLDLALAYVAHKITLVQARDAIGSSSNGQARARLANAVFSAAQRGFVKITKINAERSGAA